MKRFLLCSFALVLLYPAGIDMYLVGLPRIAADLNASEAQLHIAFSVYLAGMATAMLFAGKIADRSGRKPVAIVGAIVFMMASLLCSQATEGSLFLSGRFLQGVGAGSCYVVAFAILRDTLDERRRAKVLSLLNGITCIVPVLAPVLGHLIMLRFPWQSLFYTMSAMGIIVCLLSLFILRETRPARLAPRDLSRSSHAAESLINRFFLSRLAITTLSVSVILTFVNASPVLLMEVMEFSRGDYAITMALTAGVSMVVSFSTPFALGLFKPRTLMLVSQGLFFDGWRDVKPCSYQYRHALWSDADLRRIPGRFWRRDESGAGAVFAARRCGQFHTGYSAGLRFITVDLAGGNTRYQRAEYADRDSDWL
ncbi:multidrug efflux system protein MdtL [Salmonella enterica subsp. arizonae]|uniref:Multidrug efflux system protein MdtL n=1 Tax=Salmonella enterica subsp. arizonae TaxID=59203 RepID=A0A379TLX6_SALER|nr:multidrug efflux system protein MdtL [Salmonella enterica subsp. arizonae]